MVEEYHTGANILLAHWHDCNKGLQPFALDWRSSRASMISTINSAQVMFVEESSTLIKRNGMFTIHHSHRSFTELFNRESLQCPSRERFTGR